MSQLNQMPTFSGAPTENVNAYLRFCKWMWMHIHPGEGKQAKAAVQNFNEACATQAYWGLQGAAREFANQFEDNVLSNWDQLQLKLKERFPWNPRKPPTILSCLNYLEQEDETLDAYVAHGKKIEYLFGDNEPHQKSLTAAWARGIANKATRDYVYGEVHKLPPSETKSGLLRFIMKEAQRFEDGEGTVPLENLLWIMCIHTHTRK
ncbi:hypothetical protein N7456_011117 [Penicillium angulare]|uniref:Retrotransposon gag domain-containing protein n=1 Tax=Penicillium angulare TaxID=116970 RepID=A0A9W9ET77_9EURO|nr:hypothetical protein N7456_011117 [Penicillium angulare]